jgi:hypothetical protein
VKTSTRGKYNKNDEGGARCAWAFSMLLNGDRKEAFGAMMKANPTASIPQMTLNNAFIATKRKVNENTSAGDCMGLVGLKSNYDMFQRPTEHF